MSRVFGRPISPFVALAALLALAVVGLVLLFGSPSGNVGASEDPIAAASRERVRAALLDGCQGRATPFAPLACRFLKGGCANSIDQCACFSAMTASRFGEAEAQAFLAERRLTQGARAKIDASASSCFGLPADQAPFGAAPAP